VSAALRTSVAAKIRELAAARGVSIERLADLAGISRAMLWRVLNGSSSPTLDTLGKLADALGVGARDLMPGREQ